MAAVFNAQNTCHAHAGLRHLALHQVQALLRLKGHRQQGLAAESPRRLMEYARRLGLKCLVTTINEGNTASCLSLELVPVRQH